MNSCLNCGSDNIQTSCDEEMMRTEYICQDCGYVWSRAGINRRGTNTPKKKNPYIVPAFCILSAVFLVFSAFTGNKNQVEPETETLAQEINNVENTSEDEVRAIPVTDQKDEEAVTEIKEPAIRSLRFVSAKDVTLKTGQTSSPEYLEVYLDNNYNFTSEEIQFVSDDPEVASISFTKQTETTHNFALFYEIEGKKEGETTVYAMTADEKIKTDPIKVIVKAPIEVDSVTIKGDIDDLLIGESTELSATVEPKNADNALVTWTSSDREVLTVDGSGKVTAIGGGSAEITASTSNGKSDTCEIYVDASTRRMEVSTHYNREDDNNIGNEWSHEFDINGEPVEKEMYISEGDTLNFYAEFTESDTKPDVGKISKSYTVTEDDLEEVIEVEMEVYVTDNGGRNSGQSADYIVTFTFTVDS